MQNKRMGITATIIIAISIIGAMSLGQDNSKDIVDTYAINQKAVFTQLQNNEPVLVVDIRTAEQFQEGHLDGSSHDNYSDSATLEKRVTTIQKRLSEVASTYSLILVDDDGTKAKETSQSMTEMGIQAFYLEGGMDNLSENIVSHSQTTINSEELMQVIAADEDLYLLDVREPDELLESKIDGAVNIPLSDIFQPNGMNGIPTDKPVIVICGSGNRATIATYALAQEGIDFQVLEGGMKVWNSQIEEQSGM
ncbi:MAG: rhodanese-like domain-containing protein [Nitrosopumilus sp.]|nr:rhodanese-like domain-containing protein [Nitrosopumilus sp.]MDH3853092.1 rhodanese-like domain-containing protein [Nitrosopumilus sp.]